MEDGLFDLAPALDTVPVAHEPADARSCPRCATPLDGERFYGPCSSCRDQLRAAYDGAARDVVAAAFEPKLNVTPNAVALKE
jgi:hypothetical protein